MPQPKRQDNLDYRRSRFSTRLPSDRLYTASHYWMRQQDGQRWHVGLTKFATRMLGEPVELDFEVEPNTEMNVGQVIGWLEGFKAVTDIYCVLPGQFEGVNPALEADISRLQSDPYGQGWLYVVGGNPDADALDVNGYAAVLDGTIDKMRGKIE